MKHGRHAIFETHIGEKKTYFVDWDSERYKESIERIVGVIPNNVRYFHDDNKIIKTTSEIVGTCKIVAYAKPEKLEAMLLKLHEENK